MGNETYLIKAMKGPTMGQEQQAVELGVDMSLQDLADEDWSKIG